MTKNRWVVKAYGDFKHDAANLTTGDLPYLSEVLKKDGYEDRVKELPFLNKLVSANIQPLDDAHLAPAPYVIREITLKRGAPEKTVRVGIVGFTEARPKDPAQQSEPVYGSYRIADPFEAAKRVLPELKGKVDYIVALAYMPQEKAQQLATENQEIDTVIGARQINNQAEVQHFNRATVAYAYNETKYLGEMRFYVKSDGSIENQVNRFIALDSVIPDDPKALDTVTSAHSEFTNQQNESAQQILSKPQPASMLGATNANYVGAETCAGCHAQEYAIWQQSRHAHAMATLEKKNQQFDNECVGCHVVGFEKGGFQSLVTTPQLANVQCESCHGPARDHIQKPAKGFGQMQTPVGCVECHTQPNSPDFNFNEYWAKVAH